MAPSWPAACRVFLSRTSDFADDRGSGPSYVQAAHSAITRAGHAILDMHYFPATSRSPAEVCAEEIRTADVVVLLAGTRYGSVAPVNPPMSYCEFEYHTARAAEKPVLAFLLDQGILLGEGDPTLKETSEQKAFRERLKAAGVIGTDHRLTTRRHRHDG